MIYIVCFFAATAAVVLGFLVWSCSDVGSGIWIRTVCRNLEQGKAVLTFDDGPDPDVTPLILDILAEYDVKAYFFLIGSKAEKYPETVRRIYAEGHHIGNHTYSHSGFFPLSGIHGMDVEIRAGDSAISSALEDAAGTGDREKLFRPPFGVTNRNMAKVLRDTGHKVIGWDVRSFDTVFIKDSLPSEKSYAAVSKCLDRIVRRVRPGSVIILHDRLRLAPDLLRRLLDRLRSRNLI
ncbi:MAG: polysaccharide deacetylase family protein [Bacteroidales bacterium]|nr:polysaccharide deacetylase family protein [Bacteroidales bacterium]